MPPSSPPLALAHLYDNIALLAPADNVRPLKPRVQLPLAHADDAAAALAARALELADVLLELVEVVHAVVRHADRAHLARLLRLDERAPGAAARLFAAVRRMDQVSL